MVGFLALHAVFGCGDDALPSGGDLEVVAASAAPRVLPGGSLLVRATLRNTGDTRWPRGMRIEYQGDPSWAVDGWQLSDSVPPDGTITLEQTAGAPTGIGLHTLTWRAIGAAGPFGATLAIDTEVTCSDGVFCNGDERYVAGSCMSGVPPCDDGAACTTDQCNEDKGLCVYALGPSCPSCARPDCQPDCSGKECGDDGCGGSCATCPDDLFCVDGTCTVVTQPGTCGNPLPLVPAGVPLIGTHEITGDSSTGINALAPACNTASTAKEIVYTFTTTQVVGIDARMSGYDTVLDLRLSECGLTAASVACSDDATPPGDTGSRVARMLEPGTYYLVADGYNATQDGPFALTVRFTDGCVPQCDGRFCGDDGCGGECGACSDGEACTPGGRCLPDPCIPACDGRACGSDGCGGTCGTCTGGELCIEAEGQCRFFPVCNHAQPACEGGCGANQYCGTDCQCHDMNEPKPDMVVGAERLANEIVFETRSFDEASCAVFEGCVAGTGERKLLRFTVASVNQGRGEFVPPQPEQRPDLFEFSPCHGHYHFKGFATYALLDQSGREVVPGRKQAYCLIDSEQVSTGPTIACEPAYDCSNQGLQAGWADIYSNDLDCQWLDVTGVPPGQYVLQVSLNPGRLFDEVSFDNNTDSVPVTID